MKRKVDNMTPKILFICGVAERYRFMYRISMEIKKRFDIRAHYLVSNENMKGFLLRKGVEPEKIHFLKPEMQAVIQEDRPVDQQSLRELEKRYSPPNLMLFWEGMRVHRGYTREDSLKRMGAVFSVTDTFFRDHNFDCAFLDTLVANMQMMFLLHVFESHGRPFYCINPSRVPGRFAVSRGLEERQFLSERLFTEIKGRELTEKEKSLAEDFLREFRSEKEVVRSIDTKIKARRLFDPGRMGRGLSFLWEGYRFQTYRGGVRRHTAAGPFNYLVRSVLSEIRAKLYRRSRLFETPDYEKDYVVFFLHKQPEASTFVKAPFFLNQHAVVENIAKSLPAGVLLYLKPHFNDFGGNPLRYYRDFLCRPNIRLARVDTDSKELLRRSLGVITITGTVGWEGLLLGKPVITLGSTVFNIFDQVIHISDMTLLPEKVRYALEEYEPDEALLRKFVVAMHNGSHPGNILPPSLSRKVLSEENIRNIVDGLEREGIFESL